MDEGRGSSKRYGSKPFKKGPRRFGPSSGRVRQPVIDTTAPEDLAEYILKVLAKDPDAPLVTGRLIGKDARTITALRSLIRAAACRYGKRVDIEVS